jgi:hypothetical protein
VVGETGFDVHLHAGPKTVITGEDMIRDMEMMRQFVDKWNLNDRLCRATVDEIGLVERALGITLPSAYTYLVREFGDLYTPSILDTVVEQKIAFPDVQDFDLPLIALESTKSCVKTGMPEGYFGFASDCMGNRFCFRCDECSSDKEDSPVWYFDHDGIEVREISVSFTEWLAFYTRLGVPMGRRSCGGA